ncbi:glycosyltransferase [Prevotella sp. P5-92]|uniref:glycosyltransferase family 4 protein n=1 Tax=Prevotella sp. P5-92 TaxID=2024222 RepID=UPI000B965D05|nr:glycosyltransferase family 4 protein [Prevotella sp. P5-92]OYP59823.1 glycosyltransferase [Prevotella sp. P5-92]
MKILFLVYHGFSDESGISKKIHYQVKGLRQNGHEVHLCYYDFDSRGHRCRYVDDRVIQDYGIGNLAAIKSRIDLGCICRYCVDNGIEMVYARSFMNASPVLVCLFGKLKKHGIKCVTEIPTYPYDQEFKGYPLKYKIPLYIDMMFRRALAAKMEAIVTFSNMEIIFGQRTICISNGIDLDSIPLHNPKKLQDIHLIAVAEIHYWHGFDRLVAGLGEYYKSNPNGRKVYFHVVGWEDDRGTTSNGYLTVEQMARKYGIEKYIINHGKLFGDKLDEVFNQCVFAIGSLGRHRSGITEIKTLKNREYAARGISFIYSENDSDFENMPYIIKAPADESPINVKEIINYIDTRNIDPADIRRTVEHLSWKYQMEKVITEI